MDQVTSRKGQLVPTRMGGSWRLVLPPLGGHSWALRGCSHFSDVGRDVDLGRTQASWLSGRLGQCGQELGSAGPLTFAVVMQAF